MNRKYQVMQVTVDEVADFYGFIRVGSRWFHPAGKLHFSPDGLAGWYWSHNGLLELGGVFKTSCDNTQDPVRDEVHGPFETELECLEDLRLETVGA
ncbi:MAG TPA: hypothetical protein VLH56_08670 [Dissulfurispiraceae bacterium]|nr:hypothetical protein [Dissulfurispiraceae bacterium]